MARQFTNSFTSDHVIGEDKTVDFSCSTDLAVFAWLALDPRHPVVIQMQNFWTSVGAIMALGAMEEGQWSALTWTDWTCNTDDVGMATRGTYSREELDGKENFKTVLFDAEAREIATMRGRGVVFRNRNFEEWREGAKSKAAKAPQAKAGDFAFAPREALGISRQEHPLVGLLKEGERKTIPALIGRANGMPPANPILGGSGDHVNSVHMIEAARQALCVLSGDPDIAVRGGEMDLRRYVEMEVPFDLAAAKHSAGETVFALEQLGRECAQLTLRT